MKKTVTKVEKTTKTAKKVEKKAIPAKKITNKKTVNKVTKKGK